MLDDSTEQSSAKEPSTLQTILLVEDDDANGALLTHIIAQETPYMVVHVADSERALEVVQQLKPTLFLLDYRLPRMNGIELYDQLHALFEHVPAIILTTSISKHEDEIKQRHLVGLAKPFELDDLLETIERACNPPIPPSSLREADRSTLSPPHDAL